MARGGPELLPIATTSEHSEYRRLFYFDCTRPMTCPFVGLEAGKQRFDFLDQLTA